ncbi:MAG: alpha/beta hydrolase [Rhodospirillaceae bacterium]|nr:alpha/beta hydrolase [Rhodospirillaceae bacterium]
MRGLTMMAAAALALAASFASAADGVSMKRAYVDNRYGQLHYLMAQPADAKANKRTPLVLFHQTANTHMEFGNLIPEMARDRVVIAVDTPGYGGSDGPVEVPVIEDYMTAVREGLKNLGYGEGKPIDVLGYHTGAFTAIEFAIAEPKMIRRAVLAGVWLVSEERRLKAIANLPRYKNADEFFAWFTSALPRLQKNTLRQGAGEADWGLVIADSLRPTIRREHGHDAAFAYGAKLRERAPLVTQPVLLLALNDGIREPTLDSQPLFMNPTLADFPELKEGAFFSAAPQLGVSLRKFLD